MGDGMSDDDRLRVVLTEGLVEFLKEEGFDVAGSSIWEVRVWLGGSFNSPCVTVMFLPGVDSVHRWRIASTLCWDRTQWVELEEPLERVVEVLREVKRQYDDSRPNEAQLECLRSYASDCCMFDRV